MIPHLLRRRRRLTPLGPEPKNEAGVAEAAPASFSYWRPMMPRLPRRKARSRPEETKTLYHAEDSVQAAVMVGRMLTEMVDDPPPDADGPEDEEASDDVQTPHLPSRSDTF